MIKHKQLAITALQIMRGDDTARARAAFRGMTPAQMQQRHGESSRTRAEILADYELRDAEINAAIAWVESRQ